MPPRGPVAPPPSPPVAMSGHCSGKEEGREKRKGARGHRRWHGGRTGQRSGGAGRSPPASRIGRRRSGPRNKGRKEEMELGFEASRPVAGFWSSERHGRPSDSFGRTRSSRGSHCWASWAADEQADPSGQSTAGQHAECFYWAETEGAERAAQCADGPRERAFGPRAEALRWAELGCMHSRTEST